MCISKTSHKWLTRIFRAYDLFMIASWIIYFLWADNFFFDCMIVFVVVFFSLNCYLSNWCFKWSFFVKHILKDLVGNGISFTVLKKQKTVLLKKNISSIYVFLPNLTEKKNYLCLLIIKPFIQYSSTFKVSQ